MIPLLVANLFFSYLYGGMTIRVEVFHGGVWGYASTTNRSPNHRNYSWRFFTSDYNDTYKPTTGNKLFSLGIRL